jgi:hypothetical protein
MIDFGLFRLLVAAIGLRGMYEASRPPSEPQAQALPRTVKGVKLTNPEQRAKVENRAEEAEVEAFRRLPPQVRRQLLRYGDRWTEALFEPKSR